MSTRNSGRITGKLSNLLIWVGILAAWEMAYRVFGWGDVFPGPVRVVQAAADLGTTQGATSIFAGPLVQSLLASGVRLAVGFVVTMFVGISIGMLLWRSRRLDELFGPTLLGLQALPSVCWVPLALLLPGLGQNERAILFVLVMGSTFAIALSMRDGLGTIPSAYRRSGQMLGASGWKLYRYVIFPSSLPALAGSLRLGFSFAWRSLMGAEVLFAVAKHGLGFLLAGARRDVAQVVAIMIVMILIGMLADRWLFARLQAAVNARFGLGQT